MGLLVRVGGGGVGGKRWGGGDVQSGWVGDVEWVWCVGVGGCAVVRVCGCGSDGGGWVDGGWGCGGIKWGGSC